MNTYVRFICIIIAWACGLFGTTNWVKAEDGVTDANRQHAYVFLSQNDRNQGLITEERQFPSLLSEKPPRRVGCSRPVRLIPTHGSKPDRNLGKCIATSSFNLLKYDLLHLSLRQLSDKKGATLPRYYYVIALRRILC